MSKKSKRQRAYAAARFRGVRCIARRTDGRQCKGLATTFDQERGGPVCADHARRQGDEPISTRPLDQREVDALLNEWAFNEEVN